MRRSNAEDPENIGLARALTWRYAIALCLVATLSTGAWISLKMVLSSQKSTAMLVNVSGRQRVLSQQTALFANLLAHAPQGQGQAIREKLRAGIDLLEKSHQALVHGDPEAGLSGKMSSRVHALYFEGPDPLDRQVRNYVGAVRDLLAERHPSPEDPLLAYITNIAPSVLVSSLDRMVNQYQKEGEAAVLRLEHAETLVWALTLLLLALEAVLIFHPAAKQVGILFGRRMRDLGHQKRLSEDIINSLPGIFFMLDASGKFDRANPRFAEVCGCEVPENAQDLFEGEEREKIRNWMEEVFENGYSGIEAEFRVASGETVPYYFTGHRSVIDGETRLIGIGADNTERKRAEDALEVTASVFENSQEAVLITDSDNVIVDVNPAFTRITGYGREEVLGKNPNLLSSGRQDHAFYEEMWNSLENRKFWRGEIWNRKKSGEIYAELLSISLIHDRNGRLLRHVGVFSDISHIKMHEAELNRIAHYDALTGIPNRVLLGDRMKQAIIRTRREGNMLAVCYLDLDGFKSINDTYGHKSGDDVLVETAKRIGLAVRGGDTVARLGGDEFVVVLVGIERGEECAGTLDRILAAIGQPIRISEERTISVGASIGVSLFPLDDEDPDTLLRHADQAMYLAKQSGRNRFHIYDPSIDLQSRNRQEMLSEIREGLQKGQFELHYQPKVDLRTGRIFGAEALIRWNHPERGQLLPGKFLRLSENTSLDIEIGEWVLSAAIERLENWRATGIGLSLSINISAHHLESRNFAERLEERLSAHPELPRSLLEIEVLETAALNDLSIVREVMESCRKLGIRFALDDFGTGYSSLSYLSKLPVDALKIDQSFIRDMLEDEGDMTIVVGVIGLAKAFHLHTVAEGIETPEQLKTLLELGCEAGQGYLIGMPMPVSEIERRAAAFSLWTNS